MAKAMSFNIFIDDPEKAIKFYTEALGWEFTRFGEQQHWMIKAGPDDEPGVDGWLDMKVGNRAVVNHFRIPAYQETIDKIIKAGGKVIEEMDMGDMGHHAFCEDPEGNIFGVMWENPNWVPPARPE
jgi:predicted enzyme related to lactoylglutathione lyase